MRTRARYGQRELKRISRTATLGGLFLSFLKIGLVGFGGGLAVIAQIRTLTVRKRKWLSDLEFAEAFALAQSLPGTNAGNAVTYIGLRLRGWRGACVSLVGFILPSMLTMILLAILYKHLRAIPDTDRLFHGLNAAVVALILVTAWRVGKNTINKRWQWILTILACLAVAIFNATVIEVILAAGLIGIGVDNFAEKSLRKFLRVRSFSARRRTRIRARRQSDRRALKQIRRSDNDPHKFFGGYLTRALAEERLRRQSEKPSSQDAPKPDEDDQPDDDSTPPGTTTAFNSLAVSSLAVAMPIFVKMTLLIALASIFLRMGAITFGGGFVMIPLIESEVVETHHWLSHQEFADATALGQITPGPVLITATFIGYRVAGTLGAIVATICIFLPSFLMTIAAGSSLRRFRNNALVQSFLGGVTPAVVGLLIAAAISIARAGIHSWIGFSILILAIVVLIRFRPNPFWVIMGAGLLRFMIGYVE